MSPVIVTNASMCEPNFTCVFNQGGAAFNCFMYSYVVLPSGSRPAGQPPLRGHKLNLRGREMINGSERKNKQSSATQICTQFLDFCLIFCIVLDDLTCGA